MQAFHTAGVPPKIGSSSLPDSGSMTNSRNEPLSAAAANAAATRRDGAADAKVGGAAGPREADETAMRGLSKRCDGDVVRRQLISFDGRLVLLDDHEIADAGHDEDLE